MEIPIFDPFHGHSRSL